MKNKRFNLEGKWNVLLKQENREKKKRLRRPQNRQNFRLRRLENHYNFRLRRLEKSPRKYIFFLSGVYHLCPEFPCSLKHRGAFQLVLQKLLDRRRCFEGACGNLKK